MSWAVKGVVFYPRQGLQAVPDNFCMYQIPLEILLKSSERPLPSTARDDVEIYINPSINLYGKGGRPFDFFMPD